MKQTVALADGGKRVRVYATTKHLCVTRDVRCGRAIGSYIITHRRSGWRVAWGFGQDLRLARRWMRRFEREGGNWEYDWPQVGVNHPTNYTRGVTLQRALRRELDGRP